jgi:zinc transporter ZupT
MKFSITAPIGIAVGIILDQSLNQSSTGYLLTVVIVNAIAAGLFIYVGLEHLNAISSRGSQMRIQSWYCQAICLGSFVVGAAVLMHPYGCGEICLMDLSTVNTPMCE